ncbi:BofC C-terminal domain-containing protein [Tuberibacillus sp. Marseille-P3662]|uniref:BofC C-terminal domain-containing protein n=1 Tax=Tuberibacillus sp. Marseille-P3662 TaxID=1965358 RepID=UPI0015946547|nr:BofC C-terminal domain-containing protein [Tuberibacillus sp. Marseille-P3662]
MFRLISSICVSVLLTISLSLPVYAHGQTSHAGSKSGPLIVNLHLKKTFIDGVQIQNTVKKKVMSMEDLWTTYSDWQLVDQRKGNVYFKKKVDDLSPVSKAVGILGLSDNETLTLYKGNPDDQTIIQTFYQIDTKELQVNMRKQLKEGIRIKNKQDFKHVLKKLQQYAQSS